MIDPISVIGVLIAAGGAIANHNAAKKQAKETEKAALQSLRLTRYDLGLRQQEELRAFSQQMRAVNRQAREATGASAVSAAEAGVAGASVGMMESDIERDRADAVRALQEQAIVTIDQLQRAKLGAEVQALNTINSVPRPNAVATGLAIGGSVLDLYSRLSLRKPPTGT